MMIESYLSPGTAVTIEPSLSTHSNVGGGLPIAEHETCEPLSLLNNNFDGGSWINDGACRLPSNIPWVDDNAGNQNTVNAYEFYHQSV